MSHFEIDPDVERVLAFMQRNLPAHKLLGVAAAVADLSKLLWSRYEVCIDKSVELRPFAFIVGDNNFRPDGDSLSQSLSANGRDPLGPAGAKTRNRDRGKSLE
jgi:hypothetical protein